jgi:hypothetical protein
MAEVYELRNTDKHSTVATHRKAGSDHDEPLKSAHQQPHIIGRDGQNLESVTRIRRLFSLAQLFAFSLTFVGTLCVSMLCELIRSPRCPRGRE